MKKKRTKQQSLRVNGIGGRVCGSVYVLTNYVHVSFSNDQFVSAMIGVSKFLIAEIGDGERTANNDQMLGPLIAAVRHVPPVFVNENAGQRTEQKHDKQRVIRERRPIRAHRF